MSKATLGSWRNPPLAYIVAEIVISPYYNLDKAIPSLQDRLRSSYPKTTENQAVIIDRDAPSIQKQWQLFDENLQYGLQFGVQAFSLHATRYSDSADFLLRWAKVLESIQAENLGAFVERIGLRYIDLVTPQNDHLVKDYLSTGLQGVEPAESRPLGEMWMAGFQFESNRVNLKISVPSPKGVIMPPDFSALPLNRPDVLLRAEKLSQEDKEIGFIDTDSQCDVQKLFNSNDLHDLFSLMQKNASRTFKSVMSELAKEEWI